MHHVAVGAVRRLCVICNAGGAYGAMPAYGAPHGYMPPAPPGAYDPYQGYGY